MELLSIIRRWHFRDKFSIRDISRRTGLSRNKIRKYFRSDGVVLKFKSFTPPTISAPQALTLTNEPKANVERYDALRKSEVPHAS